MNKTLSTIMVATFALMLAACGGKTAREGNDVTNQTYDVAAADTADEDREMTEEEIEADGGIVKGKIIPIEQSWRKKTLTNVTGQGRTGIKAFAQAFCEAFPDYIPNKLLLQYLTTGKMTHPQAEIFGINDQSKKGYISSVMRTENTWNTDCCYWKRNDGHSLVAFWLAEQFENDDIDTHLIAFYDYDPKKNTMTPEPALTEMVEDVAKNFRTYIVTLPAEGKDITLMCIKENDSAEDSFEDICYDLTWNGYAFSVTEQSDR